jgi:hypothetical protein
MLFSKRNTINYDPSTRTISSIGKNGKRPIRREGKTRKSEKRGGRPLLLQLRGMRWRRGRVVLKKRVR